MAVAVRSTAILAVTPRSMAVSAMIRHGRDARATTDFRGSSVEYRGGVVILRSTPVRCRVST